VILGVTVNNRDIHLMKFEKGKVEHASLDLYFRRDQNAKLFVKGKGEVHLSGYFEPDLEE
jgi:nucleophosmin 1